MRNKELIIRNINLSARLELECTTDCSGDIGINDLFETKDGLLFQVRSINVGIKGVTFKLMYTKNSGDFSLKDIEDRLYDRLTLASFK